jgi:hypothetical protein
LRAKQSKFAVANDRDTHVVADLHALKNSTRRSKRLGKDCLFVEKGIGHCEEISDRQLQAFCECTVATHDSQNCPFGTVTRITRPTKSTSTATGVDLADYATSPKLRIIRCFLDYPDELMTQSTFESCVAAYDLEVGIANPGQRDTHDCFVIATLERRRCDLGQF